MNPLTDSRKVMIYDTETTGLYRSKSWLLDPAQPRLVQTSVIILDPTDVSVSQSISLIVRPEGWDIPDHVAEIHGITTERAKAEGHSESLVLNILLSLWSGPYDNTSLCRVAHNAPFDKGVIACSIARLYGAESEILKRWLDADDFCTMEAGKEFQIGGTRRAPSLMKLYNHLFGKEFDRAHSANADTVATMQIFLEMRKRTLAEEEVEDS